MRLPVRNSTRHKGTLLELDTEQETLTLVGTDGQTLGRTTWDAVINHMLATSKPSQPAPVRQHPRATVSIDVRYQTEGGELMESRTTGIGGGGLFALAQAMMGLADRVTFIIDEQGKIAHVIDSPSVVNHAGEVLARLTG